MYTLKKPKTTKAQKVSIDTDRERDAVLQGVYGEAPLPMDYEADSECRGLFATPLYDAYSGDPH